LLGAVVFYFSLKPGEPTTTVHAEFGNSKVTKLAHQLLLLPDGSTVLLNNNSSLDFPQQFTGDTREVILKGEAYFDIKPDASRPFIIHTGKVKTRVLGTAFNIRAYPEEID